ncbi:dnaJ-like protein subfamily C member 22 [Huso huso]|uniref:DnaJ homolog subfamily C member 22 n=1 Tax=Huso huso TaxID=61971 RepID=A0ABR0YEM0_HUSHU
MGKRKLWVTYWLWAVGGPVGLHHVYLGRDSHALLWMLTFGGFGLGWLREFYRLPAYVESANHNPTTARAANGRPVRAGAAPPPISLARFAGQVCIGIYFGMAALIGLSSISAFYLLVLPLAIGTGVHLVSSVGEQTSDLRKTLTACLVTSPVFYGHALGTVPVSIAASVTAAQNRRYKPGMEREEPLGARLYRLGLAWLAFSAPLGYSVFYNTTATLSYAADSVAALLDWLWFFPSLRSLLESCLLLPYRAFSLLTGGGGEGPGQWEKVLERFISEHSQRRLAALQVLAVSSEAPFEEITQRYRELVKTWHPDHNPHQAGEASSRFLEIQEAYETLLRLHRPQRGP